MLRAIMGMVTKIASIFFCLLFITLGAYAGPSQINTQAEMLKLLKKYKGTFLFIGHGSKGQFKDPMAIASKVDLIVFGLNLQYGAGKWMAVFGGDNFNPEKPDIAFIMKYLKDTHHVPILAIQSDVVIPWGGVDQWVDYVRYIPTVNVPVLDEKGIQVTENGKAKMKTHWGGFIDGKPKGPTEYYLGSDLVTGENPILKGVVAFGGGPIGLEEAQYARSLGVTIYYVRAEARYPEVNGLYGSLENWVQDSIDHVCNPLLDTKLGRIRLIDVP